MKHSRAASRVESGDFFSGKAISKTPFDTKEGRAGWSAVLTMWVRGAVQVAILKGLGMMLPTLKDQFKTTASVIGWMTSMIVAVGGVVAVTAAPLGRRFGAGNVIMVCGMMIGVSFIVGSFATTPIQLLLAFTVLAGSALRVPLVLSKGALGRGYHKKHALVTGIAKTGSSVGLAVVAPLIQLCLSTYGWRGTMLMISGISLHLVPCGALMRSVRKAPSTRYQELPQDEVSLVNSVPHTDCTSCWTSVFNNFDLSLLCNIRYWLLAFVGFSFTFTYEMWVIYFVSHAVSKGYSLDDAAVFVTVAGFGNLIAKVLQGFIVEAGIISTWGLMVICILISSSGFLATPLLSWYWAMMLTSSMVVVCSGVLYCLQDVLMKQMIGLELLASAHGWMDIKAAILRLLFGCIPGLIYDTTGSYDAAFIFLGSVQLAPLLSLAALKYLERHNRKF